MQRGEIDVLVGMVRDKVRLSLGISGMNADVLARLDVAGPWDRVRPVSAHHCTVSEVNLVY